MSTVSATELPCQDSPRTLKEGSTPPQRGVELARQQCVVPWYVGARAARVAVRIDAWRPGAAAYTHTTY
eukprot:COSAG02_NODE_152_length_33208_cov_13.316591_35_plen_69_part_00